MSCLDQHAAQAENWASDDISDDEKYNPTHAPHGTWMPSPETIIALFERLEKEHVLPLKWKSPGRRPPSSQRVEEPMEEEPSPVQEREPVQQNQIPVEPTEFDFDDASTVSSMATIARRQTPGSSKTPSRFQRVARMDKVLEDVMKQRKQSPARSKLSSPRLGMMSKSSPARGRGGLPIGSTPRGPAPGVARSQNIDQAQRKDPDLKTKLFAENTAPRTALIDALKTQSANELAGDQAPYSAADQRSYPGSNLVSQAGIGIPSPLEANMPPGFSSNMSVHHSVGIPEYSGSQMAYVTASLATQTGSGIASTAGVSRSFPDIAVTSYMSAPGPHAHLGPGMVSSANIRFSAPQMVNMGVNSAMDARPRMSVAARTPHALGMMHGFRNPRGLRMSLRGPSPTSHSAEYGSRNISNMASVTGQMYQNSPMQRQKSPSDSDSLALMADMAFQNPTNTGFSKMPITLQKEVSESQSVAYATKQSQFITNPSASLVTAANVWSHETKPSSGIVSNLPKQATRSPDETTIKPPPIPPLRISLTTGNDPKAKPTFIAHQVVKSAPKSPVLATLPKSPSKRPPSYTLGKMDATGPNPSLTPPRHGAQNVPVSMLPSSPPLERVTLATAIQRSVNVSESAQHGGQFPQSPPSHMISPTSGPRMSTPIAAFASNPSLRPHFPPAMAYNRVRGHINPSTMNTGIRAPPTMSGPHFGGHQTPPMAGNHGHDTMPKSHFGSSVPPHRAPHPTHLGGQLASSEPADSHARPPAATGNVNQLLPRGRMNPERHSPLPPATSHAAGHFAPLSANTYPGVYAAPPTGGPQLGGHVTPGVYAAPPTGGPHLGGHVTPPGASPHRGHVTPPRSSPHPGGQMTPPRASPHHGHMTPPRMSPDPGGPIAHQGISPHFGGHMTPPVASPHQGGHMTPPVASPHQGGHMTTPVASPHQGGHMTPPVASPHQGHMTPPIAPSHHGGHMTPPVASPHQGGHMTPPVASPHQGGHVTPPVASPHQGHMTPPLASPHQGGHMTPPVASPHQGGHMTPPVASSYHGGHVTPPVSSPHQGGHMTPPVASPHQGGHMTPPVASPHQGHMTQPVASPHQGHMTPPLASPHHGHMTPPVASPHQGGHITPPVAFQYQGGHMTPPVASPHHGGHVTPPVAFQHQGGHMTPPVSSPHLGHITAVNQATISTMASVLERIIPLPLSSLVPSAPAPAPNLPTDQ